MAEYHEADNAFQSFRIANLLGIISEDEAEAEALNDKRNEARGSSSSTPMATPA